MVPNLVIESTRGFKVKCPHCQRTKRLSGVGNPVPGSECVTKRHSGVMFYGTLEQWLSGVMF